MFSSIFIATPTHICKSYCAAEFTRATYDHCRKYGAAHYVACNSRGDAFKYYSNPPGVIYTHHPELGTAFSGGQDSIHRRITATMQFLRACFLNGNWEWFLSLESDVIINEKTVQSMLNCGQLVVHSNCYHGFHACGTGKVDRITLGCTLIHRSVLEPIHFRYDPKILGAFHDAFFAIDCLNSNKTIWYDETITVEHRHTDAGQRGWERLPSGERRA